MFDCKLLFKVRLTFVGMSKEHVKGYLTEAVDVHLLVILDKQKKLFELCNSSCFHLIALANELPTENVK